MTLRDIECRQGDLLELMAEKSRVAMTRLADPAMKLACEEILDLQFTVLNSGFRRGRSQHYSGDACAEDLGMQKVRLM